MDDAEIMAGAVRIALTRLAAAHEALYGSEPWIDNAFANLERLEELGHGNLLLAMKLYADLQMTVVE